MSEHVQFVLFRVRSISSVQQKFAIYVYLYVCIVFFYGTFTRTSTNFLETVQQTAHSQASDYTNFV